ncbi:hypothetical protein [Allorhizobium sonneratiae]|uniref:hypothetical protein n=1 Tax=Allorhizobium sonneratiae TaxID=2934936 RepID=UPI0020334C14|nr:hypothetical protein [Allorhizobium sonneratiae]
MPQTQNLQRRFVVKYGAVVAIEMIFAWGHGRHAGRAGTHVETGSACMNVHTRNRDSHSFTRQNVFQQSNIACTIPMRLHQTDNHNLMFIATRWGHHAINASQKNARIQQSDRDRPAAGKTGR